MLRIVWIVVYGGLCTELVKSPCEHSLRIHIGKPKRSDDFFHTLFPAPCLNGRKQSLRHFDIVDEVDPSEAHTLLLPAVVCLMIDDGGYSSCHLPVFICKEILCFAKIESGIFICRQRVNLVTMKVWHVVFVATIQVVVELNKLLQSTLVVDFFYLNVRHILWFVILRVQS